MCVTACTVPQLRNPAGACPGMRSCKPLTRVLLFMHMRLSAGNGHAAKRAQANGKTDERLRLWNAMAVPLPSPTTHVSTLPTGQAPSNIRQS